MIPPLPNEAAVLRAMLGIGPPLLLDIKPIELLTAGERGGFAERLRKSKPRGPGGLCCGCHAHVVLAANEQANRNQQEHDA
jgi:hypothetical protein